MLLLLTNPLFQVRLNLRQVDENVFRLPYLWGGAASGALWIDQFSGIYKLSTTITLIALGIMVVTHWAFSAHKSICEEAFALDAVLLINNLFKGLFAVINIFENILGNHCLLWSTSASKFIEVAIKPVVNIFVDFEVLIANFLASLSLHLGFGFSGSAILVSPANVDCVMSCKTSVSRKHISGKHTPNNVA